jgi:hypothetical protein
MEFTGGVGKRGRGLAELLQLDAAAVTTGRTARFPGTAVTVRRHGPNDGDGQVDGTVPGCGGDGDSGGGGRGGGSVVLGVVVKVKEERDGDGGGGAGRLSSRARR